MGKINELIKELCPDGVEYKMLSEVIDIKTGRLNANAMEENGIYPFFTCDSKPYKINNYAFDTTAIIVSGNGSQVGHINYYKGKFNAYQRTYVFDNFKNCIDKYLFHYLKTFLKPYIIQKSKKGSVPYITLPMLDIFQIPLPPLSIQQQIVDILDTFTDSISNLQEELKLREKQMEYYRESLLSFDLEDIEWQPIKELFDSRNGYTPSTKNSSFWTDGDIPWFKMEDIRDNGHILNDSYSHINKTAIKGKGLFKANSIIIATSATIGEHALIKVEHLSNQRFTNLYPNKKWEEKINMSFIYHYMFLIDEWCKTHVKQGGFASVDMDGFYKQEIPVPSLSRQQEIVDILDTFESMITNIKEEIELRQKQYEYYREKLLTFERKGA